MIARVTQTARRRSRPRWIHWIVAGGVVVSAMLLSDRRWQLVDPIGPVTLIAAAVVLPWAIWLSVTADLSAVWPSRRFAIRLAIPAILLVTACFVVRSAVEAAAFADLHPVATAVEAGVVGKYVKEAGRRAAYVSLGPGTRIETSISPTLFDRLDPVGSPGRDCLILTIETGRWGLRRAALPRPSQDRPFGIDRYRPCSTSRNDVQDRR